ncbi:MAG: DUF1730 domain-containing protein [Deltaproteobacteria bacterium]|nr:DUF1730 domain-containing protein [Deltaproteobacteria bacterium]
MFTGNITDEWDFILTEAKTFGIAALGVLSLDEIPKKQVEKYKAWLDGGFSADMDYLKNYQEVRFNPKNILEDSTTVICAGFYYGNGAINEGIWKNISSYARGRDYHKTVKKILNRLAGVIVQKYPSAKFRVVVDSAPVMERTLFVLAGLGSIGKNGMLIVEGAGSKLVLGEIFISGLPENMNGVNIKTAEMEAEAAVNVEAGKVKDEFSLCSDCSKCIKACPGGALNGDGTLDSNRCLSYYTIEYKGDDAIDYKGEVSAFFGCDICNDVCPHNRPHNNIEKTSFLEPPLNSIIADTPHDLLLMTEDNINKKLEGTALHRTGARLLKRNINNLLK